jgi:hypothetical protein
MTRAGLVMNRAILVINVVGFDRAVPPHRFDEAGSGIARRASGRDC